jgi:hypothetical protein
LAIPDIQANFIAEFSANCVVGFMDTAIEFAKGLSAQVKDIELVAKIADLDI